MPSVVKPAYVQDLARPPSELSPKTQDQDLVDVCQRDRQVQRETYHELQGQMFFRRGFPYSRPKHWCICGALKENDTFFFWSSQCNDW